MKAVVIPSAFAFKPAQEKERLQAATPFKLLTGELTEFNDDTKQIECRGDLELASRGRKVSKTEFEISPGGPNGTLLYSVSDDVDLQRDLAAMAGEVLKP